MKTERVIKMKPVEVTVYIADDGMIFDNTADCIRHEENEKCKVRENLNRLIEMKYFNDSKLGNDPLPITENDFNVDTWYATWILIRTEDDAEFIAESFKDISGIGELKAGEIVCLVTESTDDDIFNDICYVYSLRMMIREIRNYLALFDLWGHNYEAVIGYKGEENEEK